MALDKLGVYNDALLQIGERPLSALSEEREPRFLLDNAWDFDAVQVCLELVKPVFARRTVKLETSSPNVQSGLDIAHGLPADCIAIIEVYSDENLTQPVGRYVNENRTIFSEFSTIYLRYVTDLDALAVSKWSPNFAKVVSAYLAKEICLRLSPEDYETKLQIFTTTAEQTAALEAGKEPTNRSEDSTVDLNPTLLGIYNDALLIMGLPKINTLTDNSYRKTVLDTGYNSNIVKYLLEDIAWSWATYELKVEHNPSVEPEWGYSYAFDKPVDMIRFDGIWYDEYMRNPIKHWMQADDYWFVDVEEIYIRYVDIDVITNYSAWSPAFNKLVAARLAQETVSILRPELIEKVDNEYEKRYSRAKSVDAMQSPPHILTEGSWTRARYQSRSRRRRP